MPAFRHFQFILPIVALALTASGAAYAGGDNPLQMTSDLSTVGELASPDAKLPVLVLTPNPLLEIRDDLPPLPTIDLISPPDDLWQRLRNGFSMPDLDSPLVADRQAWYLNRPDLLKRTVERSRRYLYHIVIELEKRGMPTELALLPIVESSFNPNAISSASALGIWQFIPSTGKTYKLEQNWWFDQRRDIVASTNAALDYLQYIYEMHGDWHLALASYNWGEGAVGRAIAKNKARGLPTDYRNLTMPNETRFYVPKLQALKNIIAQPELFGIRLDPIPNRPYFSMLERSSNMDVALAARLAEIPVDEFLALNPAYNRPVMPQAAKSPLVLPTDKVQTYLSNLQHHEAQDKPLSTWHTHTLKAGEKFDAVARHYNVNVNWIKQLNGINPRTRIAPGLTLLIPSSDAAGYQAYTPPPNPTPTTAKNGKGKHPQRLATGKSHSTAAKSPSGKPAARSAAKPTSRAKVAPKAKAKPAKAGTQSKQKAHAPLKAVKKPR